MTTKKRFFMSFPFISCVIILAAVWVGISLAREILRNRTIDMEIKRIEAEAQSLEVKNLEVLNLVQQFEDTDFLEKEARLKLGLQKEGEKVVVINKSGQGAEIGVSDNSWLYISNPARWWNYFFKNK
jgi:cell division protein FtsB